MQKLNPPNMTEREKKIRREWMGDPTHREMFAIVDGLRQIIADMTNTADLTIKAADALAEYLTLVAPEVCSYLCPSVKYTDEPWPHVEVCRNLRAALAQYKAAKEKINESQL